MDENLENHIDALQTQNGYHIAVAGTGYVGLSLAVLLAQDNRVTAVDIVPEKIEQINRRISPIQDEYIEKYLAEKSWSLQPLLMLTMRMRPQILSLSRHRQIMIRRRTF